MVKLGIKCYLIEPAYNFISLLSKSALGVNNNSSYDNSNNNNNNNNDIITINKLYSDWITNFIDLYNDRTNFLLLANTKITGSTNLDLKILQKSYSQNYYDMKLIFENLQYCNLNSNSTKTTHNNSNNKITSIINENDQSSNDSFDLEMFDSFDNYDLTEKPNNTTSKNNTITKNNKNEEIDLRLEYDNRKSEIEYGVFRLVLFIFQYLHVFEDKSINNNLWNYSLKSFTFSKRCFLVGLLTLMCQYVWTATLIYNVIVDFHPSSDVSIILITIISTIIACLYSSETFHSFWSSVTLYKFLIELYEDYPELELDEKEREYYYYKIRNINMRSLHLKYNLCADFMSNTILPVILPFLNIFVILNSESAIDAILNSMAIFFIVQVDEELYRITEYSSNQETIIFTRWIISTIYCKYLPDYERIFKKECETWHNSVINMSNRYKKNSVAYNSKIEPDFALNGFDD